MWRDAWTLRLKARTSASSCYRSARREIVPLTALEGTRTDVLAHPYILVPDITLRVQRYPQPDVSGAIGEVRSSDWEGMQHEEVGNCQGWFYHEDRTIVLWETYFDDRFRRGAPSEDPNLTVLWTGFERYLVEHFPTARQLVTTSTNPLYETDRYQRFLSRLGYTRVNQQAFGKSLPASPSLPEQP